ncbi:MAG: alpha/beta hydrolase [Fimbriimonadaceae bacterium]|nr:alpha/beta hydrolase [Fimbriimonadaceae bacterium]
MIDWTPCLLEAKDGDRLAAFEGSFSVLEDRSSSVGRRLRLRVVRIPAREPSMAPPVVFLCGGPGDSAIRWPSHGPFLRAFRLISARCDLVLLDQRGCGLSEPDLRTDGPSLDGDALGSEEAFRTAVLDHVRSCALRFRETGVDLAATTVVASAADVADLAEHLGGRVSLLGYSYGTHLAQFACRLYEDRIERVVLCGFEGPDQTLKLPSNLDAQLSKLDALASPAGYALRSDLLRCLNRSESESFVLGDGRIVGAFTLRQMVSSFLGLSNRFARLPAVLRELAEGGTSSLERALSVYARGWSRPLTFYLKDAASGVSSARRERIVQEGSAFEVLGDAVNFPFPEVGDAAGAGDIGDAMRQPLTSELPFLILTGSLDGFTPTVNATESLGTLPNATHREIAFAAHNDLLSCPEANAAIEAFLSNGSRPAEATEFCVPSPWSDGSVSE